MDAPKTESVDNLLSGTGWVNANISHNLSKLMLLRNIVNHRSSSVVMDELLAGQQLVTHDHDTRARQWMIAWRTRYRRQESSFLPSVVKMFNELGLHRTGLGTKSSFKSSVRQKLIEKLRNTNI